MLYWWQRSRTAKSRGASRHTTITPLCRSPAPSPLGDSIGGHLATRWPLCQIGDNKLKKRAREERARGKLWSDDSAAIKPPQRASAQCVRAPPRGPSVPPRTSLERSASCLGELVESHQYDQLLCDASNAPRVLHLETWAEHLKPSSCSPRARTTILSGCHYALISPAGLGGSSFA